jgi:isoleucyl-tRNA synthetase
MDYFRIEYLDKGRRWFYADYEPTKAARAISDFVQENLSNWYVRCAEDVSERRICTR